MRDLISLFNDTNIYNFLLLFARIVSFVAFMPVFSHQAVNSKIRVFIALFFTIFLFSFAKFQSNITETTFLLGLIKEITLGLVISFLFQIVFWGVSIIGDMISYATALSMANMFDPASGSNQTVVSRFLYLIALVIYLDSGMYEISLYFAGNSLDTIVLGSFNLFDYDGIKLAIIEMKKMFEFAFAFALPLFFIGFILDIYYSYAMRAVPSFSPFIITFQIKFALIFLFLIFSMEVFVDSFKEYFFTKFI